MPKLKLPNVFSRKRKRGDETYNARRRFTRSAERYLDKADNETGVLADRYRQLARGEVKKALDTYEKEPKSGVIKRLMNRLGISKPIKPATPEKRAELIRDSKTALEGSKVDPAIRREREARSILNSKIGKRIYGGTVSIWKNAPEGDRDQAIMDYFGVESMADVIEQLEGQVNLYSDPESLERYDTVRLAVEAYTQRLGSNG